MRNQTKNSKTKKTTTALKVKKITVVFVCTGNTCRSPVAERLFKHHLKMQKKSQLFKVSSLGLSAYADSPMSINSQQILKNNKITHINHRAKVLTIKALQTTDYFICMTAGHKVAMPNHPQVHTIASITNSGDVADPYRGTVEMYQKMFEHLEYAIPEVLDFIEKQEKEKEKL